MKIPICQHCQKLLIPTILRVSEGSCGGISVIYRCPEDLSLRDPVWVEVELQKVCKS